MTNESFILPNLSTERLNLRQLTKEDVSTIFFLRSDESINKFINRQRIKHIDEALDFILKMNKGFEESNLLD